MTDRIWYCRRCEDLTEHDHAHDCAHGIPETHMSGTERFTCKACGLTTHASDEGACHFTFVLDGKPPPPVFGLEFDCKDCGAHVVAAVALDMVPVCAICRFIATVPDMPELMKRQLRGQT
jgi:hypothetical protein